MTDKPKRLQKLEDRWRDDDAGTVDNEFGGEWMVYVSGHFAGFELHDLVKALKAANKAGKL